MKTKTLPTFQSIILSLERFWADHGCVIWQPHNHQVGAGTMNPATFLRVLGPEPWNVAYVEPSIRPDDGRYGENPNRFQQHYQYQVILKPDPGNPQELYLQSLEALGLNPREHDIRFVEDNWASPALGAWGLGWEVWVDGQEITQFTYFQQAGGLPCDPVSVELTYGLERILIALRNAPAIWDEPWTEHPARGAITYGDLNRQGEFEHSRYYFEVADVERLRKMFALYEEEAKAALAAGLVLPSYDYVLKCSHTFNVLDARGAIGVNERQASFARMRGLARQVAEAYVEQRQRLEYPLLKDEAPDVRSSKSVKKARLQGPREPATLLLEIGTEELPAADVENALAQLEKLVRLRFSEARLKYSGFKVFGTPRRLALLVDGLEAWQEGFRKTIKGPPENKAFDKDGNPTQAALGWAKAVGLRNEKSYLRSLVATVEGGRYLLYTQEVARQPAVEVLRELLPRLIQQIEFDKTMRWRAGDPTAFARPIRWIVALLDVFVIPFEYAGLQSDTFSRGLRPLGSPEILIPSADDYLTTMAKAKIEVDPAKRRFAILKQVRTLASRVRGRLADEGVLDEVTNLVERPTALRGAFDRTHLALPRDVLIAVMKKHQRYFPVERDGQLLPYFIAVRNGDEQHLDVVREGNEHVLRARFADATFFVREDVKQKLVDFRPRLATLTFQQKLGSMLDKSERVEKLTAAVARRLTLDEAQTSSALRAAHLCKADLATRMVVEMTSLQGIIGREYALRSGETPEVALAIREHYLPAGAGDALPESKAGLAVGLADRLDSLVGLFAVGLAPTGSADPFGLRRAALGVVRLLVEKEIDLELEGLLVEALTQLPAAVQPQVEAVRRKLLDEVLAFIAGRLRGQLIEAGYRYDVVEAVLAEQRHNPQVASQGVKQLSAWVQRDGWPQILAAYSRCVRITRDQRQSYQVLADQLKEPAEKALYEAYQASAAKSVQSVDSFFAALVPMLPTISRFFEDVLVMAEDQTLRENRLGLLQQIAALAKGIADFSKLEGF